MIKLTMISGNEMTFNESESALSFSNGSVRLTEMKKLHPDSWIGIKEKYNPQKNTINQVVENFPKAINEDVAYIVGLISGDGYISHEPKVRFFNKNSTLISTFCEYMKRYFRLKVNPKLTEIRRNGKRYSWYTCTVYSKAFKEFLLQNFNLRSGNKNSYLRIPPNILTSDKKIIAFYLAGLFDADGTVVIGTKNVKFEFVAKNKCFAIDISKALRVLGANSIIREDNVNRVRITSVNEIKKLKGFPIKHPEKCIKLNKIIHSREEKTDFRETGKLISSERTKAEISQNKLARLLKLPKSTLLSYEYGTSLPPPDILKVIGEVLKSKKLLETANSKNYNEMKSKRRTEGMKSKTTNLYILPKDFTKNVFSEIMNSYGLSQTKISKLMDSSQGRIGCYCRGLNGISIHNLRKMSKIFETKSTRFFNDNMYWDRIVKVESNGR
jgi:transcriptional regulator with XRE-family HTH domain